MPEPGPRRSDTTRAAILTAARQRFAADGYDRATVRAIARDAAIDPSMVIRYYGSKEALFAAAIDVELALPDPRSIGPQDVGVVLVRHFLHLWETSPVLVTLLRVSIAQSAAAARMRDIFRDQLIPVARRFGHDDDQAALRATLVSSQILGMALLRYVLRLGPAADLPADDVVAWLAPTIERYITGDRPRPEPPGVGTAP